MPDTKFSFAALKEHLRRYFWVYLIGIAACLLGTNLLWTTTAPRPTNEQTVTVFLADVYTNPEPLSGVADAMLKATQPYDENLKLVEFQSLQYNDNEYTSSMLLMTRLAVGEGDAFLASQSVMDALVQSQALEPLDAYVADGWLAGYDLEPYYATYTDEEEGISETFLAALKLDNYPILMEKGAFISEGGYLCVTSNGGNVDTTMKALEAMMAALTEEQNAQSETAK